MDKREGRFIFNKISSEISPTAIFGKYEKERFYPETIRRPRYHVSRYVRSCFCLLPVYSYAEKPNTITTAVLGIIVVYLFLY